MSRDDKKYDDLSKNNPSQKTIQPEVQQKNEETKKQAHNFAVYLKGQHNNLLYLPWYFQKKLESFFVAVTKNIEKSKELISRKINKIKTNFNEKITENPEQKIENINDLQKQIKNIERLLEANKIITDVNKALHDPESAKLLEDCYYWSIKTLTDEIPEKEGSSREEKRS